MELIPTEEIVGASQVAAESFRWIIVVADPFAQRSARLLFILRLIFWLIKLMIGCMID